MCGCAAVTEYNGIRTNNASTRVGFRQRLDSKNWYFNGFSTQIISTKRSLSDAERLFGLEFVLRERFKAGVQFDLNQRVIQSKGLSCLAGRAVLI